MYAQTCNYEALQAVESFYEILFTFVYLIKFYRIQSNIFEKNTKMLVWVLKQRLICEVSV